jgi:preprotein translocase subunit SecE
MWAKITNFIQEVIVELRKVSWPDRKEMIGSTSVVILSVIILTVFIMVCDYVLTRGLGFFIR